MFVSIIHVYLKILRFSLIKTNEENMAEEKGRDIYSALISCFATCFTPIHSTLLNTLVIFQQILNYAFIFRNDRLET